jgi:thiosulfate/3-mercaptopyruvate sulfurtransferase
MNITLITIAVLTLSAGADAYPNPELLIEADSLAKLDLRTVVILDTRDSKAYNSGHVPGANLVPTSEWTKAVPDTPEAWTSRLGKLGIKPDSSVIVYGGIDVREAARIWWLLKYAGASDVRLLNGGLPAWEKAGGNLEKRATALALVEFGKPAVKSGRLAEKADVISLLKAKNSQIVDARSNDEFCGVAGAAKRKGHIPGATPLEWTELLTTEKKFKSPDELKKLFAEKKIDLEKPVVTYCQSGGRAAVVAFGLELMGAKDVKNYYKSWSEWGNAADTPVELPKK